MSNFDEIEAGNNNSPENNSTEIETTVAPSPIPPSPESQSSNAQPQSTPEPTYIEAQKPMKKSGFPIRIIALCLVFALIGGLAGGAAVSLFGTRFTSSRVQTDQYSYASKCLPIPRPHHCGPEKSSRTGQAG